MDLILLPGNSPSNRPWIDQVSKSLAEKYPAQHIQYYRHWNVDEGVINFQYEMERLVERVNNLKYYSIVAKSAGVLLTLKAVNEANIAPKKCVFLGTPVPWGHMLKLPLTHWFENLKMPCLYVQQTNDPAMPAEQLEKYLRNAHGANYGVKEIPGDDHEYGDVEAVAKVIKEFIS